MDFMIRKGAMTLQHLKIFIAVCREGGVYRGGEEAVSLPAGVSFAIKELVAPLRREAL
jgi:DNA-binding transcriptional LysR family regulator